MKKSTARITVIIILLIVAVVGYYAYLSGKSRAERAQAAMTFVESTLSRNLDTYYPSTPKEVVKYFNDIQKCFFNEECTEEELDALIGKLRELFDEELLEQNSLETQSLLLKKEIQEYKEKNRKITNISIASSANVIFDTVDGRECAKLHCGYNVMEGSNNNPITQVFLLRKDSDRKWRIYGWKLQDDFQETQGAE